VGYLCANFSLFIGLSVLDLRPDVYTRPQTPDAYHRLMPPAIGAGAIGSEIYSRPDRTYSAQRFLIFSYFYFFFILGRAVD